MPIQQHLLLLQEVEYCSLQHSTYLQLFQGAFMEAKNPETSAAEPQLYHERQSLRRCGLHAVNNALQRAQYTVKDFEDIAKQLHAQGIQSTWFNPHKAFFSMGNYDVNVIETALSRHGKLCLQCSIPGVLIPRMSP